VKPPFFLIQKKLDPPFDVRGMEGNTQEVLAIRDKVVSWWRSVVTAGDDSLVCSAKYASLLDDIVRSLFNASEKRYFNDHAVPEMRAAAVALGGYGRCEMSPYSDLDLLFLYDGKDEDYVSAITSGVLYPLWDAGFEVGCATRNAEECRRIAASDPKTFTSMLDARMIAGDENLVHGFRGFIKKWFSNRNVRHDFVKAKLIEHHQRKIRYGDSINLLQPNVKDGEGGLRDFHTLVWLIRASYEDAPLEDMMANAGVSERSIRELFDGVRFIWRVRQALHLAEGRRQDRLTEDKQIAIAEMLNIRADAVSSPAECLMREYYKHAAVINRRSQWAFERMDILWSGKLQRIADRMLRRRLEYGVLKYGSRTLSLSDKAVTEDPVVVLEAFAHLKKYRLSLDAASKEALVEHAPLIDVGKRSSEGAHKVWRELFKDASHLGSVLAQMRECGVMERWFPEMGPMFHRIQHDGFHIYTVDVHTVHALTELSNLTKRSAASVNPVAAEAMRSVKRAHVMLLAMLLHDVGKGYGDSHERLGADIARDVVLDMGFTEQDAEDISFLVLSHMLMPKLAFRRDINDTGLIERFAQTVRTPQMLTMLYLVTFADLRSVGPVIWNAWKEGLLNDLYLRTRDFLKAGGQTEAQQKKQSTKKLRDVKRIMGKSTKWDDVESFVSIMPNRYLLSMTAPLISTHFAMVQKLSSKKPISCDVRNEHERGVSELSIVTHDAQGLFAKIAGVIASQSMNIVEAELYTAKNGIAVDVIRLTDLKHRPVEDAVRWKRVMDRLSKVIADEAANSRLTFRIGRRWKSRVRGGPPRVEVDNDVSATETVVEIHADDEPGILHRIASAIAQVGFTIDRARISTHVDRVIDVFYIREKDGQKVSSRERLEALREALEHEIIKKG